MDGGWLAQDNGNGNRNHYASGYVSYHRDVTTHRQGTMVRMHSWWRQNQTTCADFPNVVAAGRCYAHAASDAMFRRPVWLCLRFASCVATQQNATFWGAVHHGGGYDPQIWTRQRFLYNAPIPQVSSSYVYLFGSYRVEKDTNAPTNKQIPTKTSNVLRYATTLGKH